MALLQHHPRSGLASFGAARASALAALCFLAGCGGGAQDPEQEEVAPPGAVLARERASARFERFDFEAARAELAPLVAREDAAAQDLVHAAAVEFALHRPEAASQLLLRAEERGGRSAAIDFLRGEIAFERGELETAVKHLESAVAAAPADLGARFALGSALQDLGRFEPAERHFRSIVELGLENGETWYVAALVRLHRMLRGLGREAEAEPLGERWEELAERGVQVPRESLLRLGRLGWVEPPAPRGSATTPATKELRFQARALELPALAGAVELGAQDFDADTRMDVLARRADALVVALRTEHGWDPIELEAPGLALARAFDLDNDRDLDLVLFTRSGAALHVRGERGFEPLALRLPELPAPPADAIALDFDHDGDLDLLLAGSFGARLWRNDGAWVEGGALTDVTREAGLPVAGAFAWCVSEDFDSDGDVDLLCGGADGARLADNRRGGRFEDRSKAFGTAPRSALRPVVADFDADSRPDLWLREARERWRQTREGSFERMETREKLPAAADALDLDLDGALDLVWPGGALLAAGLPQERLAACTGWPEGVGPALAFADFDDDLMPDALLASSTGATLLRASGAVGNGMRLRLVGNKDNARAVGTVVELRAGAIYRRIYYRGEPVSVGVGANERVDVLRVRWPNGLVQTALDRDLSDQVGEFSLDDSLGNFAQEQGLIGSCPFLYTWNGETFEFVTDVLGITPLGLPMAPGMLVPFDHDEYVLVRKDQLVPRDGKLEMVITEELREVTYLDRVRLDVIDHPAGSELQPNERFTFPPFPEPIVHVMGDLRPPRRASGSDGRDWTGELRAEDGLHALPFEREPAQFFGLARPWWLELELERELLRPGERLRLVATGWFNWTDASVNVAAARHPGIDFVPPTLSVPDGAGGWRELGPPVGFPAGKTKTMVIELDARELVQDPRLRIACTLELYWDRIAFARGENVGPIRRTELEPDSATLWERGFSARAPGSSAQQPERFEWHRRAEHARWDQHPGLYTRYGECRELLLAIDDRFAILGAGDALSIAFDASALPPLEEGWTRSYLLFLDGWAKDRDPNTVEALEVEPLPFHGMSTYPYPSAERFPDGELHERWRREWNTRPARRWIEPLAPKLHSEAGAR